MSANNLPATDKALDLGEAGRQRGRGQMADAGRKLRLDGWKSIAAHFGRERTTVMRWATERGLPIHRIPGAGRGSVYALTEELDAWLGSSPPDAGDEIGHEPDSIVPANPSPPRRVYSPKLAIAALFAATTLGLAVYAWPDAPAPEARALLPENAQAASIYVEARADWARRTPDAILRAIEKLKRVTAIEPQFAPAYSALADCYLLAREFGSLPDVEAFARAQAAVDTALKINPNHAGALRARGFVDYWWRGDRAAAARDFERSLALDSRSAQTLFWFANALIDNGDFDEGMRRFAEARLLEPASPAIAADVAWAQWSVGETQKATAALLDLRREHPGLATVPDYLSVVALSDGDIPGFVREVETMATLRQEEGITGYAAGLRAASASGTAAVAAHVIDDALAEVEAGDRRTLAWPAFVASAVDDRARLVALLRKADARSEIWGSAGLRRHVAAKWRADGEITGLLKRREAPSLVAAE